VLVNNFDLFRPSIRPLKYDSPLIAYANRMLPREVSPQRLQAISGRSGEITQQDCGVELCQFAASDLCDILRDASLLEDQPSKRSAEAPDHHGSAPSRRFEAVLDDCKATPYNAT
jgi:hypothetical protein